MGEPEGKYHQHQSLDGQLIDFLFALVTMHISKQQTMSWEPNQNLATLAEDKALEERPTVVANISRPQSSRVQLFRSENVTYSGIVPSTAGYHSFLPVVLWFFQIFTDEGNEKAWLSPPQKETVTGTAIIMWQMEDDSGVCGTSHRCYNLSPRRPRNPTRALSLEVLTSRQQQCYIIALGNSHPNVLRPSNHQPRKGVTIMVHVMDSHHQEELRLLLYNGARKHNVCHLNDPWESLGQLLWQMNKHRNLIQRKPWSLNQE